VASLSPTRIIQLRLWWYKKELLGLKGLIYRTRLVS
jgi:hypothetical protein